MGMLSPYKTKPVQKLYIHLKLCHITQFKTSLQQQHPTVILVDKLFTFHDIYIQKLTAKLGLVSKGSGR